MADDQQAPPAPGWRQAEDGGWHPPATGPEPVPAVAPVAAPKKANLWPLLGIFAFCAIGVVACVASLDSGSSSTPVDDGPSMDAATNVCEQAVKDQLKSPSTAKFSGETGGADTPIGKVSGVGTVYTVTGHVDAENSFGASLRNSWTCTATATGGVHYQVSVSLL